MTTVWANNSSAKNVAIILRAPHWWPSKRAADRLIVSLIGIYGLQKYSHRVKFVVEHGSFEVTAVGNTLINTLWELFGNIVCVKALIRYAKILGIHMRSF